MSDVGRHQRVAELAAVDAGDLVVADLGCGDGRTVRALLERRPAPATVHALDQVSALDDDLLHDERVRSRIVDLDERLPFSDASIDRLVSLNVVEHLLHPLEHLRECGRVLRPGGRLVLAHSDWDTALFTSTDDELTRVLVDRFVAEEPRGAERADGFMGRKLLALAAIAARGAGLDVVLVDSWADTHRRFDEGSLAWKVALGLLAAARDDEELTARAAGWMDGLRRLAGQGRFLFTVTDVAVVLRRR
jgi:SAM-dependent methyltransferase